MKENICEQTINTFLELDKDERLGFKTTLHLLSCKKCRTVVRLYTLAQRSSSRPLYKPDLEQNSTVSQILSKANPSLEILKSSHIKPISMMRWIIAGCMLVCTLLLFGIHNANSANPYLQITIYISVSLFICIYCAFFIGSNLDFFVKQIDKNFHNIIKKS